MSQIFASDRLFDRMPGLERIPDWPLRKSSDLGCETEEEALANREAAIRASAHAST